MDKIILSLENQLKQKNKQIAEVKTSSQAALTKKVFGSDDENFQKITKFNKIITDLHKELETTKFELSSEKSKCNMLSCNLENEKKQKKAQFIEISANLLDLENRLEKKDDEINNERMKNKRLDAQIGFYLSKLRQSSYHRTSIVRSVDNGHEIDITKEEFEEKYNSLIKILNEQVELKTLESSQEQDRVFILNSVIKKIAETVGFPFDSDVDISKLLQRIQDLTEENMKCTKLSREKSERDALIKRLLHALDDSASVVGRSRIEWIEKNFNKFFD